MTRLFLLALLLVGFLPLSAQRPVPIILDTDIGPDYDDVGAVAMLHALADRGEVQPLAIISCNKNELIVPTIDVLNTWFGRPNLPTGAPKGTAVNDGAWQKWPEMLVEKYPHRFQSTAEAPDAVTVYQQILSRQPDHSVTIVTIGFLTNLATLLESQPDKFSRLNGRELIQKKVKQLVSMAGLFPKGREFNVYKDSLSAERAFAAWPTPIILSGFEIGRRVKTGPRLLADSSLQSPVKDVFAWCMPKAKEDRDGRMSWDQTAVLVAARGTAPYYTLRRGRMTVQGGNNDWQDDLNGPHAYLVEALPVGQVTEIIERLMMAQPLRSR